jgi:hypothetical protein
MKKCLWLLASAVVLAGCGEHTDVADNTPEEPRTGTTPAVASGEKSGTFTVNAKFDPGATFQNASANEELFEFIAKGEWSFAPGAGMLSPNGADVRGNPNYLLPGARSFAMVAKREDGTVEFAGDRCMIRLKPKETVTFAMNEAMGSFGDNRGSLTVDWSVK